jgi:hypothetical protein
LTNFVFHIIESAMILANKTVTGAAAAMSIVAGVSISQAKAADNNNIINPLKLSMDGKIYVNPATQTLVKETCRDDGNAVSCDMQIMANGAFMKYDYKSVRYQGVGKYLILTLEGFHPGKVWSSEVDGGEYKTLSPKARQNQWSGSIPLDVGAKAKDGTVIQNDVRTAKTDGNRAEICSFMPISEARAIRICQSFAQAEQAEHRIDIVVAYNNSAIIISGAPAKRPYTSGDASRIKTYEREAAMPYFRLGN